MKLLVGVVHVTMLLSLADVFPARVLARYLRQVQDVMPEIKGGESLPFSIEVIEANNKRDLETEVFTETEAINISYRTSEVRHEQAAFNPEIVASQCNVSASNPSDSVETGESNRDTVVNRTKNATVNQPKSNEVDELNHRMFEEQLAKDHRRGPPRPSVKHDPALYGHPMQEWYLVDPLSLEQGYYYGQLYGHPQGVPAVLPVGHGWW